MSIKYNDKTNNREILLAGVSPVDVILSPTSKNAIANKTVYNALLEKVEKTVTDLINYYTKSDTYNKAEVRELIGAINTLTIEVVSSLPSSDISTTTIYFLKQASPSTSYDEYVYVNNAWVKIGDTNIDLSQYVTSSTLTTALQDYYNKAAVDNLLTSYYTKTEVDTTLAGYYDKDDVDDLLDDKQNKLTFDNTPTANSNNPVTSAGIKSAIDAIPSNPVDAIINNDMHAITSNAIFDFLNTNFRPAFSCVQTNTSVDLNDCVTPGFAYFLVSPANANSNGSYGYLLTLRYGSDTDSNANIMQVHFPYHRGDYFSMRCRYSGVWTNWNTIATIQ